MTSYWCQRYDEAKPNRAGDHRSVYQRDKARILHSAAFRRLQAKTQVLGIGKSDFYRTRLTHSLEVAQIGQGITEQLKRKFREIVSPLEPDHFLIEALCYAHDIGHPPFGHGGEIALHYKMHKYGGFEGNAQTFRIVTKLEPYSQNDGMNLSRRTLLGLVKYPNTLNNLTNTCSETISTNRQVKAGEWHPPKGLYDCDNEKFDWLLKELPDADRQLFIQYLPNNQGKHHKTCFKSFDCSIMELADDIAYSIHDLEDAIVMGIVRRHEFNQSVSIPISKLSDINLAKDMNWIEKALFEGEHYDRKNAIGALVNSFITAIEIKVTDETFITPLLKYNASLPQSVETALSCFKRFVFQRVISMPEIQQAEYKGQQLVMELFDAFSSDPERLLPNNTRKRWEQAQKEANGIRVIADYIAGMTDEYAAKKYHHLFLPNVRAY